MTLEDHRELAIPMFNGTKVEDKKVVRTAVEAIENKTEALPVTHCTLAALDPLGDSYFMGNFMEKGRLIDNVDFKEVLCENIVDKCRELDHYKLANSILKNK